MTPDLPGRLRAALEARLEGVSRRDLAARADRVSRAYRGGAGSAGVVLGADDALAYALARLPATYAADMAVLAAVAAVAATSSASCAACFAWAACASAACRRRSLDDSTLGNTPDRSVDLPNEVERFLQRAISDVKLFPCWWALDLHSQAQLNCLR